VLDAAGEEVKVEDIKPGDLVKGVTSEGAPVDIAVTPVRTRHWFGITKAVKFSDDLVVSWSHVVSVKGAALKDADELKCGACAAADEASPDCDVCRPVSIKSADYVTSRACDFVGTEDIILKDKHWYHLVPQDETHFGSMVALKHDCFSEFFRTPLDTILSRDDMFEVHNP